MVHKFALTDLRQQVHISHCGMQNKHQRRYAQFRHTLGTRLNYHVSVIRQRDPRPQVVPLSEDSATVANCQHQKDKHPASEERRQVTGCLQSLAKHGRRATNLLRLSPDSLQVNDAYGSETQRDIAVTHGNSYRLADCEDPFRVRPWPRKQTANLLISSRLRVTFKPMSRTIYAVMPSHASDGARVHRGSIACNLHLGNGLFPKCKQAQPVVPQCCTRCCVLV